MENEQQAKIYNKGFKAGQKHTKSSEETLKLFKTMEEKFDNFKKEVRSDIKGIGDKLNDVCVQIAGLPEAIFEKGNEKYASKNVEKFVYGVIVFLCLAVGGYVVDGALERRKDVLTDTQIDTIIERKLNSGEFNLEIIE